MSEQFVVTLGTSGLVKGDLDLRVYQDGAAKSDIAADLTVTELTGGDYRIDGLPAVGKGTWMTGTFEYPSGVGGFYVYPTKSQTAAPPNVIIPVRETGLSAGDLNLSLLKNGVVQGDALTATEVGSPGDYKITGWPADEAGDWLLVWRRGGISFNFAWTVTIADASACDILADLSDMFPHEIVAQPGSTNAFGEWTASGSALTLDCLIEGETKLVRGANGTEVVSSVQAIVSGFNSLNTTGYRYTLPNQFDPNSEIEAIGVDKVSDEDGFCYEEVMFP